MPTQKVAGKSCKSYNFRKGFTEFSGNNQKLAQRILRDKLGEKDVKAEALKSALNENAGSSMLSRLRRKITKS